MPWQQRVRRMMGKPVGISLRGGKGVSGILCDVRDGVLFMMEFEGQDRFTMKQYRFNMINSIDEFPPCGLRPIPWPRPR